MAPFDLRLLRLVPQTRRPVAALGALGVIGGLATLAGAFALTTLVVAVVRGEPILVPALVTLGVFGVRGLLAALSERVAAWAGAEVSTQLRDQLLATWLARPAEERPDPARALTLAAQGTASVEPYVAKYLPTLITAAVVPPLAILTLLVLDWPAALVVVLTLPLLPLFAALIGMSTAEDTQRRWRALSDLSGHFLDVMTGLPTLVGYGRGERQVGSVREVSQRHRRATMRTLRLAFMSSAALELLATISVAIVAVLVGLRLTYGSMDLWVGMLAILLAPEAYWPVRRVGAEFHSAADGAEAVQDILGELAPVAPADAAAQTQAKGAEPGEVVVTVEAMKMETEVQAPIAGTVKAHYDTSVTPDQYQFLESAFLLAAVVLGGMGTIAGVILGAVILKLMPEKLRFFNEYRLLLFGLLLVLMMRFRPEGLVANRRRQLEFHEDDEELADEIGEWKVAKEEDAR